MARKFLTHIDLNKNQLQNALAHILASAPGSPTAGQWWYDSTNNLLKWHNGTAFIDPLARANHSGTQTAATISDLATVVQAYRLDQFAIPTAALNINNQRLTNVGNATVDTDAPNYGQVKSLINGMDWKQSVVVAVSTNVTTSSPGATLDGVTMTSGDRVLLYGQTTTAQNGLWIWNGAASAMTRPADYTGVSTATGGLTVAIEQGTQADKLAILTTNGTITVDTTATAWTIMSAGTAYSAGNGLSLTTNTFAVVAGPGITVGANVAIDTAVVVRKFAAPIGDGSSTSIPVTHNLGTQDVTVSVRDASTHAFVDCDITANSTTQVTLGFTVAPALNSLRVVVHA